MLQEYSFIAKVNLGLSTMISLLSTPVFRGGQDQLLKVSIYTCEFEQLFCGCFDFFLLMWHMSKFAQNFAEATRITHCNGSVSALTKGHQHCKCINNQAPVISATRNGAYLSLIIFAMSN
jgi:hypothetical protein